MGMGIETWIESSPSSSNVTTQVATEPSIDCVKPVCRVDLGVIVTGIMFSSRPFSHAPTLIFYLLLFVVVSAISALRTSD